MLLFLKILATVWNVILVIAIAVYPLSRPYDLKDNPGCLLCCLFTLIAAGLSCIFMWR